MQASFNLCWKPFLNSRLVSPGADKWQVHSNADWEFWPSVQRLRFIPKQCQLFLKNFFYMLDLWVMILNLAVMISKIFYAVSKMVLTKIALPKIRQTVCQLSGVSICFQVYHLVILFWPWSSQFFVARVRSAIYGLGLILENFP